MVKKNQPRKSGGSGKAVDPRNPSPGRDNGGRFVRYCLTLLLLGAVALVWLSLLSFSPSDPPSTLVYPPNSPVDNRAGLVGSYLGYTLRYWAGSGIYGGLVLLTVGAGALLVGKRITDVPWRLIGLVLLIAGCSSAAYLRNPAFGGEVIEGSAGILGAASGRVLLDKFGPTGSWVVLLITICIALMLSADKLLKVLGRGLWRRRNDMARTFAALRRKKLAAVCTEGSSPVIASQSSTMTSPPPERPKAPGLRPIAPSSPLTGAPVKDSQADKSAPSRTPARLTARRPDRPDRAEGATQSNKDGQIQPSARGKKGKSTFHLPSMDLLLDPEGGYNEAAEIQAVQRKLVLQQTLEDFNVEAKVVGYMTGPVITLFEVSLAPGVKVSMVTNLAMDIARALAVSGVRIVPPRFGKDTVGIEVPNLDKEIVRIKELMMMKPEAEKKMALPLYLGKDAGGEAIVADLGQMPHMLIAGTTGSGKSVCINAIIISMLMNRTPRDVRFILVDPKMVEMASFERLPHLLCPTVHDVRKAEDILEWAVGKMDERYELLRATGVKNLAAYNRLSKKDKYERFAAETEEEQACVPLHLPAYVIIIDELADLMMTSSKEVEAHIIRIAQKARAVGIHLVLATQRPSANVVTGLIKSNMPCRISFRVASGQESRIVLDHKGAEILLGQGDMLLLQPGDSNLIRAQGTFVEDSEIRAVVRDLVSTTPQEFNAELIKLQSSGGGEFSGERDEMFDQAVDIVLASRRGSVSLLQRRMQIGYGRASRIIDQMAESGVLGEHKGSQARECMITLEDWEQMKASIAADQSGASSLNGEPTSS